MLGELEAKSQDQYEELIEMHESKSMRGLYQSRPMAIVPTKTRYDDGLFYGGNGFYAKISECIEEGNWAESGTYRTRQYNFKVVDGMLEANTHEGKKYLVGFLGLTSESIENKICKEIEKLPAYKGAKK